MEQNYIKFPKNVKLLAKEIITILDDYWSGKIKESEVKELILHYAKTSKLLCDNGKDLNATVKKIIGQQRVSIVNQLLSDYQMYLSSH